MCTSIFSQSEENNIPITNTTDIIETVIPKPTITPIDSSTNEISSQTNIEPIIRETITKTNSITNKSEKKYPELPSDDKLSTNVIYSSTNYKDSLEDDSSSMVNLGFFFMQEKKEFADKFSEGRYNENTGIFYNIPSNSWNDLFYVVINYDYPLDFLSFLKSRWGWSIGINLAGSGNDDGDSSEVGPSSDLGKANNGLPLYLYYNDHTFPLLLTFRITPVSFWLIDIYTGVGGGWYLGLITYNELVEKDRSEYDKQFEKTFIKGSPVGKIFIGIAVETIEELQTIFLEINYKFVTDPIVTNDYLQKSGIKGTYKRSIRFQTSGWSLGFGFRY